VDVALVAVQAALDPDRYRDAGAYRAWLLGLAERAVDGLPDAEEVPRLLAFPEMIGLPLPWLLDRPAHPRDRSGAAHRVLETILGQPAALARAAWTSRRLGPSLLHHPRAVAAGRVHAETFAEVAREARATVVAGTWLGPPVDVEAARGWHVADPRPRNRALLFGPTGTGLGVVDKVFLTAGAESWLGLRRGRIEDLRPIRTPVGELAVAICLDAFHEEAIARLDGQGARIVVQPSANPVAWDRAWPPDPRLREGEAWWRFGLPRALEGRTHLRAGVNPMLVGEALGLAPRGRSTVVAAGAPGANGLPAGVVAVARHDDREEVVRALLRLDERRTEVMTAVGYAPRPT
jgi:predicted amidohydrolase